MIIVLPLSLPARLYPQSPGAFVPTLLLALRGHQPGLVLQCRERDVLHAENKFSLDENSSEAPPLTDWLCSDADPISLGEPPSIHEREARRARERVLAGEGA